MHLVSGEIHHFETAISTKKDTGFGVELQLIKTIL